MVAYLTKIHAGYELNICARPCNGAEYQAGQKIAVAGKREARAYCAERGIKTWNF